MSLSGGTVNNESEDDFVNRKRELSLLKEHMEKTKNGEGRFVLLRGEAGVGKTDLAEYFAETCFDAGFEFLKGRCLYHESTDPYLPFFEALDDYIETEDRSKSSSSSSSPSYTGIVGQGMKKSTRSSVPMSMIGLSSKDLDISADISISDKREMMFEKITNLIKKISRSKPVLLFFDDLQWIDESSSQLLHHLSRSISKNKVFILGAYRPEELRSREEELPLRNTLNRMREEKLVDEINVNRLDFPSVSKMLKKKLHTEDIPQSFIMMIFRETEGNPYYIIEILDSMVEEGVIDPYSYTWDPESELTDISIPSTIKDITSRRIKRLSKDQKRVLMYASIIGTDFDFEVLEHAMNMDVVELLDIVDELENIGIIHEKEGTDREIYRFNHLQLRMTLYEDMGKSRKRVLQGKIGESIEGIYSDNLEDHYYSLSRHFYKGKKYEKAYEYSKKAGEKAISSFAIEQAREHLDRALRSLRKIRDIEDKEEKEKDLLLKIGELDYDSSSLEDGKKVYSELIELAKEVGDKEVEAKAYRDLGHIHKEIQEFEESEKSFDESLRISQELDNKEGIADSNRGLGYIHWRRGEFEESIEHYETAIDNAKTANNHRILAITYIEMGLVYAHRGDHDLAIQYFKRSLPPLKSQNAYRELSRAYNDIGDQFMKKEEWDTAIENFDKSIEFAQKIGNKSLVGWGYFNKSEALAKSGDINRAKDYIERAHQIMKNLNDMVGLSAVYKNWSLIYWLEEDWAEAINYINKALDTLENLDIPFTKAECRYQLARIYEEKGESEKAIKYFNIAQDSFRKMEATQFLRKIDEKLSELEETDDDDDESSDDKDEDDKESETDEADPKISDLEIDIEK